MSRAKAVFIPPAELVVVARSSYPKQREGRSPVWGAALSIYAVISRFAVPSKQLQAAGGYCRPVHIIIRKAIVTISHSRMSWLVLY